MHDRTITEKILAYIECNLEKELTLEKIAGELNYSKFYMERSFKDSQGLTIYKYIQKRRLEEAAGKLANSPKPIIEIALEAGYSSQQAFTQAFRRQHAYTPQEYRRRMRRNGNPLMFSKGTGRERMAA